MTPVLHGPCGDGSFPPGPAARPRRCGCRASRRSPGCRGPHLGPVADQEVGVLIVQLEAEVLRQEGQHPRVAAIFVVRLQDVEHEHVRPEVGAAVGLGVMLVGLRAEPAVGLLAGQRGLDPAAGVVDDPLVVEHVAQVAVALEPIGHLFPAVGPFALGIAPGAALELAPGRHLGQVAGHAVGLKLQLVQQPALRLDGADGQLRQRAGHQRGAIGRVEAGRGRGGQGGNHLHVVIRMDHGRCPEQKNGEGRRDVELHVQSLLAAVG